MLLNRKGSKAKLAPKIIPLFPKHNNYIEPFFGGGSIFFQKEKAKYNFLNDLDDEVFNLHQQLQLNPDRFKEVLDNWIICQSAFKTNIFQTSSDPVIRAVDFLIRANYSLMSSSKALRLVATNTKHVAQSRIPATVQKLDSAIFTHQDFRKFLQSLSVNPATSFCYCDPPYQKTSAYSNNFTERDLSDLLDILISRQFKFAVSEFDDPFVLSEASSRGLNIINIGERHNISNRRTEILLTNY